MPFSKCQNLEYRPDSWPKTCFAHHPNSKLLHILWMCFSQNVSVVRDRPPKWGQADAGWYPASAWPHLGRVYLSPESYFGIKTYEQSMCISASILSSLLSSVPLLSSMLLLASVPLVSSVPERTAPGGTSWFEVIATREPPAAPAQPPAVLPGLRS